MADLLGYSPNKKGNADRRGEGFFIRSDALRTATNDIGTLRVFCSESRIARSGDLKWRVLDRMESEWEEGYAFIVNRRLKTFSV